MTVANCDKTNKNTDNHDHDDKKMQFRRFLSQFMATSVINILLFDLGLCLSFPGIIIPAVTGFSNEHNVNETLTLTPVQASWFGSISYIPIGSLLSTLITDTLGRRGAMFVVNIPLIVAWIMMYSATSVLEIFIANILMGLGIGMMDSPIATYFGEICEPSLRGMLIAYSNISVTVGLFVVFVLNTLMPWRSAALLCLLLPIISIIALCFIPETPLWLLSKNRITEAEKSLCWLRGWAPHDKISTEFKDLQRYSERSKSCSLCIKQNTKCQHPPPTTSEKLRELKRKQTLKPLFIIISLFFISLFSGIMGMSPFIVQIMKVYESPIAPDQTAAILGFVNNFANVSFLVLIRFTGKRKLFLTMLMGTFLCAATISVYGFVYLPSGYNSFDKSLEFSLENKNLAYIPFVCIILWTFCSFCGVYSMAWQMLSEVFPYKARGTAIGLASASNYLLSFISIKSYYNLETMLSLPGVAAFNCVIILGGFILMYKILPETENRTLEDIELHFSDNSKKLTDRKIKKSSQEDKRRNERSNDGEVIKKKDSEANRFEIGCDNKGFTGDR